MTPKNVRSIQILLVEDSPSDAELTLAAMKTAKVANEVTLVPGRRPGHGVPSAPGRLCPGGAAGPDPA